MFFCQCLISVAAQFFRDEFFKFISSLPCPFDQAQAKKDMHGSVSNNVSCFFPLYKFFHHTRSTIIYLTPKYQQDVFNN